MIGIGDYKRFELGKDIFYIKKEGEKEVLSVRPIKDGVGLLPRILDRCAVVDAICRNRISALDLSLGKYYDLKKFLLSHKENVALELLRRDVFLGLKNPRTGERLNFLEKIELVVYHQGFFHDTIRKDLKNILSTYDCAAIFEMCAEYEGEKDWLSNLPHREILCDLLADWLKDHPDFHKYWVWVNYKYPEEKGLSRLLFQLLPERTKDFFDKEFYNFFNKIVEQIREFSSLSSCRLLKQRCLQKVSHKVKQQPFMEDFYDRVFSEVFEESDSDKRVQIIWDRVREDFEEIQKQLNACSDVMKNQTIEDHKKKELFDIEFKTFITEGKNLSKKLHRIIDRFRREWKKIYQQEIKCGDHSEIIKPVLSLFADQLPISDVYPHEKEFNESGWTSNEALEFFRDAMQEMVDDDYFYYLNRNVQDYVIDFIVQSRRCITWSAKMHKKENIQLLSQKIVAAIQKMKNGDQKAVWIPAGTKGHAVYLLVLPTGKLVVCNSGFGLKKYHYSEGKMCQCFLEFEADDQALVDPKKWEKIILANHQMSIDEFYRAVQNFGNCLGKSSKNLWMTSQNKGTCTVQGIWRALHYLCMRENKNVLHGKENYMFLSSLIYHYLAPEERKELQSFNLSLSEIIEDWIYQTDWSLLAVEYVKEWETFYNTMLWIISYCDFDQNLKKRLKETVFNSKDDRCFWERIYCLKIGIAHLVNDWKKNGVPEETRDIQVFKSLIFDNFIDL